MKSYSSIIEVLIKNRTQILLAEIGAYLHDLGKAKIEFIKYYSKDNNKSKGKDNNNSDWDKDMHNFPSIFPEKLRNNLRNIKVKICDKEVSLMDFIEKHHPEIDPEGKRKDCEIPPIIRLLYAAWNGFDGMDSGLDKGRVGNKEKVGQRFNCTFIANAFGYEMKRIDPSQSPEQLYKLINGTLEEINKALREHKIQEDIIKLRNKIIYGDKKHRTREMYRNWLGETRRPANDVTLWDHSYSVATLFKCAIVKNIVDCSKASFDPLDFNWKILSVNFNVLDVLSKGIKLSDILGYLSSINKVIDVTKKFIETEYPIGNEIYRDTTGIYFLVADIELEEYVKRLEDELKKQEIEPELMPYISIKETKYEPSKEEDYKFNCNTSEENIPKNIKAIRRKIENDKKDNLKEILVHAREEVIKEVVYPASSSRLFISEFETGDWENKEVCPICNLRPMKSGFEGCKHCINRRIRRSEEWLKNPKNSIWLDEISDKNNNIALIVGSFILEKWLDGSFIKSLAIKVPNSPNGSKNKENIIPKNPSPARIRRCWETTEEFIKHITHILKNRYDRVSGIRRQRIQFRIKFTSDIKIRKGATCDILVDGITFSPVCIDENKNVFVSTINLELLNKFGKSIEDICKNLNNKRIKVKLEGKRSLVDGEITEVKQAEEKFKKYYPYTVIYSFPDQFMVLVPAYDALDIVKEIVEEYKKQFSKVRDRLSFHIGIIAFPRKMPLHVVMDAGKRLLESFKNETETKSAKILSIDKDENKKLIEIEVEIEDEKSQTLKLEISYSTGDPEQDDIWHPYIRVSKASDDLSTRTLVFTFDENKNIKLVHVTELKKGDEIQIEPSYFKLCYLKDSSERFWVGEDLKYLDYIFLLDKLGNIIESKIKSKKWSLSQIYAYWEEVEKRKEYDPKLKEMFIKDAITNFLDLTPNDELYGVIYQATVSGALWDCLFWNLKVKKLFKEVAENV